MTVRVGVDVGGTFTKAVAFDLAAGAVVAQAVLPTTHDAPEGVAAGVVQAVADVAAAVGADQIELVTHSTTQAVNALLEGDVGIVGVIGLGRRPDLQKARKRTMLSSIELSPGKRLATEASFFDVTDGLPEAAISAELERLLAMGATSVCVAETFAPDDAANETRVSQMAAEVGLPSCASTELSGLYGLELRAVTAAINASILPIALRTAGFVEDGVLAAGVEAPLMVMRGDGGATDLEGFRRAPARTLYSGPAASVAGALRFANITDGVVVEVGGTSTNVAAVRFGRPALSYVQVASHATALRAIDVRVVGVAGGSMLRVHKRRTYGVGPRSAHIAGLPYSCFLPAERLVGCRAELVSPKPGDPDDYVVLVLADGGRAAITTTCAANAIGVTEPGDYAYAPPGAALAAFDAAAALTKVDGTTIARQMLQACGEAVCELVAVLAKANHMHDPSIVAVGGGAGGLGRHVAAMLGLECTVPDGAEVISSLGDALSLVRAERERTVDALDATIVRELLAEVEAEALAAGASPAGLDVRLEERPERGTVRAIATGSIGLMSGALPGRGETDLAEVQALAPELGGGEVVAAGRFWLLQRGSRITVLDRFAEPTASLTGERCAAADLAPTFTRLIRYRGPVTLRPSIWLIDDGQLIELSSGDVVASATALADVNREQTFLVGRAIT